MDQGAEVVDLRRQTEEWRNIAAVAKEVAIAFTAATSKVQTDEAFQYLLPVRRQVCLLKNEYECLQLGVPDREVEDVHNSTFSSESIPISSSTLPD